MLKTKESRNLLKQTIVLHQEPLQFYGLCIQVDKFNIDNVNNQYKSICEAKMMLLPDKIGNKYFCLRYRETRHQGYKPITVKLSSPLKTLPFPPRITRELLKVCFPQKTAS